MPRGLAEHAAIALAVERGRQLVEIVDDPPDDLEGLLVVPVPGGDPKLGADHRGLAEETAGRRGEADRIEATTWCKVPGTVGVSEDRLEAIVGAGVWHRDLVEERIASMDLPRLAFLDPHVLKDAVTVEDPGEPGTWIDVEADVDAEVADPVLRADRLRDRHNLIKTAMGLMV